MKLRFKTYHRVHGDHRDIRFRQLDSSGNHTGRYIMNFEFHSLEGHDSYKERRKNWDGPYEEYKSVDPYEHFIIESVTVEYWEPLEQDSWLSF